MIDKAPPATVVVVHDREGYQVEVRMARTFATVDQAQLFADGIEEGAGLVHTDHVHALVLPRDEHRLTREVAFEGLEAEIRQEWGEALAAYRT